MQSSYLTSAQKADQLPEFNKLEVAFLGRSNCGKSSLLNALLCRKNLARSSRTPGRTQMVNFFEAHFSQDCSCVLADLPGYGYNLAAANVQKHWDELMNTYLNRSSLVLCFYLFDIRREMLLEELGFLLHVIRHKPVMIILTKVDKLSKSEQAKKIKKIKEFFSREDINPEGIHPVSTLKEKGLKELRSVLITAIQEAEKLVKFE